MAYYLAQAASLHMNLKPFWRFHMLKIITSLVLLTSTAGYSQDWHTRLLKPENVIQRVQGQELVLSIHDPKNEPTGDRLTIFITARLNQQDEVNLLLACERMAMLAIETKYVDYFGFSQLGDSDKNRLSVLESGCAYSRYK